jgi:hypothetical protein
MLTFEAAKKQKAAGLIPDDVQIGQIWYNENGSPSVIVVVDNDDFVYGFSLIEKAMGNSFTKEMVKEHSYFAQELPPPKSNHVLDVLKELNTKLQQLNTKGVFYAAYFTFNVELGFWVGRIVMHNDGESHIIYNTFDQSIYIVFDEISDIVNKWYGEGEVSFVSFL